MITLVPNQEFTQLASEEQLTKTVQALETNGQASAINKILIVNGEALPGRITIVLVKQNLGF